MKTETLTVAKLAEMIQSGEAVVIAADADLKIEPLADASGVDVYPETEIEFKVGEEVIASVGAWKLGIYMKGPNRHDTGEYIGNGWSFLVMEDDGQTSGRPYESRRDDKIEWKNSTMTGNALVLPYDDDVSESDIETIQDAINEAYDEIDVSPADDDDVYEEMVNQRSDRDLYIEILDERIEVGLYAAKDAGRTVYTYAGAEEVWEDAEDMIRAAKKYIESKVNEGLEKLDEYDTDGLASLLEAALEDD